MAGRCRAVAASELLRVGSPVVHLGGVSTVVQGGGSPTGLPLRKRRFYLSSIAGITGSGPSNVTQRLTVPIVNHRCHILLLYSWTSPTVVLQPSIRGRSAGDGRSGPTE